MSHDTLNDTVQRIRAILDQATGEASTTSGACCTSSTQGGCCPDGCDCGCCTSTVTVGCRCL